MKEELAGFCLIKIFVAASMFLVQHFSVTIINSVFLLDF